MAYQITQELCSCCHQCKVNCPVGAIRFKGVKYWIDPEKCIDCGLCAKLCHNCVIYKEGGAEPKPPAHEPIHRACDLVVCGAGASGLVAAVRTAQAGKKVIVLEKNGKPGGNSWYAGANNFHYTRFHKEAGIPDLREDQLREFQMRTEWRVDVKVVEHLLQTSDKFIDWLIDECDAEGDISPEHLENGVGIMNATGESVQLKRFKRPDRSIGPGGFGTYMVLKMMQQCEKLGVEVLLEHEAEHLLPDENGAICGVSAKDPGGITEIKCNAVVLATGCFSRNEELLRIANPDLFFPGEPVHFFSVPTCTGDGIRMAKEVGGRIDYKNMRALSLGPAHHPFGYCSLCVSRLPYVIFINKNGKRWVAEENSMAHRYAFQEQPGLITYFVADTPIFERSIRELLDAGYDGEEGAAIFQNYKQELEEESSLDTPTKKADTLEELARLMGVDEKAFVEEVERYNEFCRKGHDDDFHKSPQFLIPIEKPPFYAFFGKRFQENAMGGMEIDSKMRVKKETGGIIPGLYAVGDNSRGIQVQGDISVNYIEREFTALTWATSSGFMAVEDVLEYLA